MENTYCVYKHTAPNGKVYIGITKQKPEMRWRNNGSGYESSPHFHSAILKYGWDAIEHEILMVGLSKDEACAEEKRLIAEYKSDKREYGYNATFGGEVGPKLTAESKRKISDALTSFYADESNRDMVRQRMIGIKRSDETRAKISASQIGRKNPHSDKWKEIVSIKARERFHKNEKYREFMERGIAEAKKKSRLVIQYDLEMNELCMFESTKQAQRETGVRSGNISKCCNGIVNTAGEYIWRYAN